VTPPRTAKADFSRHLGGQAYPGALAANWGAYLVEPAPVGALRAAAAGLLTTLGDLAPAHSGIPTRSVKFFCLEEQTDTALLDQHGLRTNLERKRNALVRDGRGHLHVLEREALRAVIRRPGVLEGRIAVQEEAADPWRMLYVHDDEAQLQAKRWRHTLAYLAVGASEDFRGPENGRRHGGVPADRPQVRVRSTWWAVPTMPIGTGRICWIKGRGDKHYVPVLPAEVLIPDNFLYSSPPEDLPHPRALAACANLSWTHLMAEVHGRRAGGDGVLHTYVRELNRLPLLDPRRLTDDQAEELVGLFDIVAARPALTVDAELREADRQALDAWAMRYLFGADEADAAARTVERALRDLAQERGARAASGAQQERKAAKRLAFDPDPIATRVLLDIGQPPDAAARLATAAARAFGDLVVDVPPHPRAGSVTCGESLFDSSAVLIDGDELLTAPSVAHADAVALALRLDANLEGPLTLPLAEFDTAQTVHAVEREVQQWADNARRLVATLMPEASKQQRRVQVLRSLERQTHLATGVLSGT
jgi:hypothetical protein